MLLADGSKDGVCFRWVERVELDVEELYDHILSKGRVPSRRHSFQDGSRLCLPVSESSASFLVYLWSSCSEGASCQYVALFTQVRTPATSRRAPRDKQTWNVKDARSLGRSHSGSRMGGIVWALVALVHLVLVCCLNRSWIQLVRYGTYLMR